MSSKAPSTEFYPAGAPVPEMRQTDRLLLRPLTVADVDRDYEAVMSSTSMLRRWSQSDWPADDFTLAENRADLERHEREHRERQAFTFTVLDVQATTCLGCVYITPLRPEAAAFGAGASCAANVAFWVRAVEVARDLDRHLLAVLRDWLRTDWAFDRIVFTIGAAEERQAALLVEAGLEMRQALRLSDGRDCRVFA